MSLEMTGFRQPRYWRKADNRDSRDLMRDAAQFYDICTYSRTLSGFEGLRDQQAGSARVCKVSMVRE